MAARKNDSRRAARAARNDRNLNRALTLFTAGFVAEFYLLMINTFYVKGSVEQLIAVADYLSVMAVVGAAVFGAGVVLVAMRKKWTRFAFLGKWLLGVGGFFAFSSLVMRRIYPAGTTAMCILVPVLMLLSVVFLLYQREFAVQTVALSCALAAAVLLNHGASSLAGLVKALVVLAILAILALCFAVFSAQKNGGALKGCAIFPAKTNYQLMYGVLAFSEAMIVLSLAVVGGAYWAIWATAIVLFALAVWYTVKML